LQLPVSGVVSVRLDYSFGFLVPYQCVWFTALGFWCRISAFVLQLLVSDAVPVRLGYSFGFLVPYQCVWITASGFLSYECL
jgi:hypothetical protein